MGFAGAVLRLFIIFNSNWDKDEPQSLRYAITPNCSKGADGGHYIKTGPLAVCVTWAMGDGSRLRLRLNLSEQGQSGLAPPESRLLRREGEAGPDRLGPWSLDFSLSGTGT